MKKYDMDIQSLVFLRGPNIWTYYSAIEALIDIGDLEDCPSNLIPGFYERLVDLLPSLIEHRCNPGVRGGFLQRLRTGTWPCHILEHVTIALQDLAGVPGHGFGRARETETRGVYKVIVSGLQEEVTRAALFEGRELVLAAIENRPYDLEKGLDQLKNLSQSLCLGPSTASIFLAAEERDIPAIRLNNGNLIQLGYGNLQRRVWTAETDQTSAIAETISRDKDLTKSILDLNGIPVPLGKKVNSAAQAWQVAQAIGLPVVIKPIDGNHGRGVFINLDDESEIETAFDIAQSEGSAVIVERFIEGIEHRLLIVDGKLAAAAKGKEAYVTGDQKHTVTELIEMQLNSDPRRGNDEIQPLNLIGLDSSVHLELKRQGLSPESVPADGQKVLIQRNGNVAYDCTDSVHPEVAEVAIHAAKAIGLDIAGIDLVTTNVARPLSETQGAIVEVNAGPGLLMHLHPAEGTSRNVGSTIIEYMFPSQTYQPFPLIGVTGSSGTLLTSQLIYQFLMQQGHFVGLSNSEGLMINDKKYENHFPLEHSNVQRLLMNCNIQSAVVETSGLEILKQGLDYIQCKIGVVTDIRFDSVFKDHDVAYHNLENAEDLIKIYRTQIDVVSPCGTGILNADDPTVVQIAEFCKGSIIYFSCGINTDLINQHLSNGHRAVLLQNNEILLAEGDSRFKVGDLSSIQLPRYHNENALSANISLLAAVASAWGLGISKDELYKTFETFSAIL
jgi:cyanophycin synthetase